MWIWFGVDEFALFAKGVDRSISGPVVDREHPLAHGPTGSGEPGPAWPSTAPATLHPGSSRTLVLARGAVGEAPVDAGARPGRSCQQFAETGVDWSGH
jgi:hypothetical protein